MNTLYKLTSRTVFFALTLITALVYNSNATKHVVSVTNFAFTPSSVTINLGDTMEWTFGNGTHTTTSTTIPAGAAVWSNSIDASHLKFDYVPTVVGTYNYKCNIHPTTMLASFTVVCPTASVSISAGGPTTFCKPGSVTLSVSAGSGGPFTSYQWKKGANNIAGATDPSFVATGSGSYKLVVTNGCASSATSNAISVTGNTAPAATVTPAGPVNICQGQTAVLTANTGANLTYQWKKGANNIAGATNNTLTVSSAATYKVNVTNSVTGCSKLSKGVKVNVNCKDGQPVPAPEVTVYPNPSSNYFVLNTASVQSNSSIVTIYDLTGKLMERVDITGETTEVGGNLPAGVYFAKIEMNGEMQQVLKLMKLQ